MTKEERIAQAQQDIPFIEAAIEREYDDMERAQRVAYAKINEYRDRVTYLKKVIAGEIE